MTSRIRRVGLLALFTGCAVMLAVGCGSDAKKTAQTPDDSAGAAGAAGSPDVTPEGGSAGSTVVPNDAGAAGQAEGGTAGDASAGAAGDGAGAGGDGPLACAPDGTAVGVEVSKDGFLKVCRGALALADFSASESEATFTCCGTSDTTEPYAVAVDGWTNHDAGGLLAFAVPEGAPSGEQSITLACSEPASNTFDIEVTETLAPVVTSAEPSIGPYDNLHITGTHLASVDRIIAYPVEGISTGISCGIVGDSTDTSVTCNFDGLNAGNYLLFVGLTDCGYAQNVLNLTITQPTLTP